jgi:hypothetical protein
MSLHPVRNSHKHSRPFLPRRPERTSRVEMTRLVSVRVGKRRTHHLFAPIPVRRGKETSPLLPEHRTSLAVLLGTQLAFGEAPLEYVDRGFPTAARPGWASTAAAYEEHDADDEQKPEQWRGQNPPPGAKGTRDVESAVRIILASFLAQASALRRAFCKSHLGARWPRRLSGISLITP